MDSLSLSRQIDALRRRVASLSNTQPDVHAKLFAELYYAVDQLHAAEEALRQSERALGAAVAAQAQEQQQALDTFNHVPVAYIITSVDGTIRRLNAAAAAFLNQSEKFLHGKSLGLFIPEGERRSFRADVARLQSLAAHEERIFRLQPHGARVLDVAFTIGAARDRAGRAVALHWLLRDSHTRVRRDAESRQMRDAYTQS